MVARSMLSLLCLSLYLIEFASSNTFFCTDGTIDITSLTEKLYKTCNNQWWNPKKQVCCTDGPRVWLDVSDSKANAGCCANGVACDKTKHICCGTIGNIQLQEVTGDPLNYYCCGTQTVNKATQKCCTEGVVSLSDTSNLCCGSGTMSSSADLCCDSSIISSPPSGSECCGTTSFVPASQLCCDQVVYNVTSVDEYVCCGNNTLAKASETHKCCVIDGRDTIVANDDATNGNCCGSTTVTTGQVCCDSTVYTGDTCCTNGEGFDSSTKVCCDGTIGDGNECCDGIAYQNTTHMCCENVVGEGDACCAAEAYVEDTHECCEEVVGEGDACCHDEAYVESTHECCIDVVGEGDECCGPTAYVEATHECCDGVVGEGDACCLAEAYVESTHECCIDVVGEGDECCGPTAYVEATHECCDGVVGEGDACCLAEAYVESTHECCIDVVGEGDACCDDEAYNSSSHMCCEFGGDKKVGLGDICCELEAYTEEGHKCCGLDGFKLSGEGNACCLTTTEAYFTETHTCCPGWNGADPFTGKGDECCGDTTYHSSDPANKCCENTDTATYQLGIGDECCEDLIPYTADGNMCCVGEISSTPFVGPGDKCCGDDKTYDSSQKTCCEINDGAAPEDFATPDGNSCCGLDGFDSNTDICCPGVVPSPTGTDIVDINSISIDNVECCGVSTYVSMDKETHICCGDDTAKEPVDASELPDINDAECCQLDNDTWVSYTKTGGLCCGLGAGPGNDCCGGLPFDTNNEVCCEDVIGVGDLCCDTTIHYDSDSEGCCNKAKYNLVTEVCCPDIVGTDESVRSVETGTACCDTDGYDADTKICCYDVAKHSEYEITNAHTINIDNAECCFISDNFVSFDNTTEVCCEDGVGPGNACCDKEPMDTAGGTKICCDGVVGDGNACCGANSDTPYDNSTNFCCDNTDVVPLDGVDAAKAVCCGSSPNQEVYDEDDKQCCDETVVDGTFGCCGTEGKTLDTEECCNDEVYDTASDQCCSDTVVAGILGCCGAEGKSEDTQSCCGSQVIDSALNENCCNNQKYVESTHDCCGTDVIDQTQEGCCEDTPFTLDSKMCCDSTDITDKGADDNECCKVSNGQWETYDNITEDCCEGQEVFTIDAGKCCQQNDGTFTYEESKNACCGEIPYDNATEFCCEDVNGQPVTVNVIDADNGASPDKCCGDTTYLSTGFLCCDDALDTVVAAPNGENECCFPLPPDTSTPTGFNNANNICCAGSVEVTPTGSPSLWKCCNGTAGGIVDNSDSSPSAAPSEWCSTGGSKSASSSDPCGSETMNTDDLCCLDTHYPACKGFDVCYGSVGYNSKTHEVVDGAIQMKLCS